MNTYLLKDTVKYIKRWLFTMDIYANFDAEIEEAASIFSALGFIDLLLKNSSDAVWIYNIETTFFQFFWGDEGTVSYDSNYIKQNLVLGERLVIEDRKRGKELMIEGIGKSNLEKRNVKIPDIYLTHIDKNNNKIPSVVNMIVYYDQKKQNATHVIGVTRKSYKKKYCEALINSLSPREKEAFLHYIQEKSKGEIRQEMQIFKNTLSTYFGNIRRKSGLDIDELRDLYLEVNKLKDP